MRKTQKYLYMALLVSMSLILSYFKFPIIPIVSFLTLDCSDIPILLALSKLGYKDSLYVLGLKLVTYWLLQGANVMDLVGVLANGVACMTLLTILYYLKGKKAIWKWAVSTIGMTTMMALTNLMIFLPLYIKLFHFIFQFPLWYLVIVGVIPFNLIKGAVLGIIYELLVKHLPDHYLR